MVETLHLPSTNDRATVYAALLPQVTAVIEGEEDVIANLANVAAILKEAFGFLWVGFYRAHGEELVLGPFQGPMACTRIAIDRGVCGTSLRSRQPVLVPDVARFPGHIACSTKAKSEVVVPLLDAAGAVWAVLDIDSEHLGDFTEVDLDGLGAIVRRLSPPGVKA